MAIPRRLGLVGVLAVSAALNTVRLSQNGYANIFYSAGVKSMLRSWHNFLYVAFDPSGLVTVDKPPLALWVQAASAKVFSFTPLSLLLPEAVAGAIAVAALYLILQPRLGTPAAFAGALAMAVFPSFVAVSRENGVDTVLILLLVLACGAALRACDTGHTRTLICSGALVGLAFNTKTLAAYLVVPGIAAGFLVCAPGSIRRRAAQLAAAGIATLAVSFAWIAFVELTPASQRPYVGSSTDNTELGLTFSYNGFGRVQGQAGGPNSTTTSPGAYVPAARQRAVNAAVARSGAPVEPAIHVARVPKPTLTPVVTAGRERYAIPFGGPPSVLRLFGVGLGDQAGWLLPFALFGALALALAALVDRKPVATPDGQRRAHAAPRRRGRPRRRPDFDRPRMACALVLGGWFLVEALVLSLSKGIVHPYYVSALAPGTGAMAGAGAVAFATLAHGRRHRRGRALGVALAALAIATTAIAQAVLLHRERYMQWFIPVLVVGAGIGMCAHALLALRGQASDGPARPTRPSLADRLATPALLATFALLLVAPAAYSTTSWLAPADGTFPTAGPRHVAGDGGYGINAKDLSIDAALSAYVTTHHPGSRWALLTVASNTAAPMILFGLRAGALGGYSGNDPALDGPDLARLIARRQARYVLLGGEYSLRGGNRATVAVLRACRELAPSQWNSPLRYPLGLVLFDCAGRERSLAAS
jgi:4-amino-4-deoxy-L-arabinose transferase-like glycosyltransferase